MAEEGKKYLISLVNEIVYIPNAFRISVEGGKYIFSISTKDQKTSDWYAVSAIYDSICENDKRIKFAFEEAISFDLLETLENYNSYSTLTKDEDTALYHVENMAFRVSILWDLLAQLCNVIYHTNLDVERIYYNKYFDKYSKGENTIKFVQEIKAYIDEVENSKVYINPWPGNHVFLKDYRNQMMHRVSPNISSISALGITLRPPTMYILHRVTEDYHMVSSFLFHLINHFLGEHKNWMPFGMESTDLHDE